MKKTIGTGLSRELTKRNKLPQDPYRFAIGTVVDTADPLELGRICAQCPTLKDPDIKDLDGTNMPPWADCLMPFGGHSGTMARGPEAQTSDGEIAYGFWSRPAVGSQVLILQMGGYRICLGNMSIFSFFNHTLPHGRHINVDSYIVGPMTSKEQEINPLYDNIHSAFGKSYEYISRGADYQTTAVPEDLINKTGSFHPDDKNVVVELPNKNKFIYSQGYGQQKRDVTSNSVTESQTYSWVTPGFHSISMDDRFENCRMRFRTTTGHQIILDDTNERILINTNGGKSFIEMDSNGNIDIHAERHLAFHSNKDMSFTSDGRIRFRAQKGIHMLSDTDIRLNSTTDTHIRTTNVKIDASGSIYNNVADSVHIKAQTSINIESTNVNTKASTNINLTSGTSLNFTSSTILFTATVGYFNGPVPALQASPASTNACLYAFSTNRVPFRINAENVPWSRSMLNMIATDKDTSSNSINYYDYDNMEHSYESVNVGKVELGETIPRNNRWRR